jgi:rRNA maturation protein Nop10
MLICFKCGSVYTTRDKVCLCGEPTINDIVRETQEREGSE